MDEAPGRLFLELVLPRKVVLATNSILGGLATGLSGLVRSDVDLSPVNADQPAHLRQIAKEQRCCLVAVLWGAGGRQPRQFLSESTKPDLFGQRRQLRQPSQSTAIVLEPRRKRSPALLYET